MKNHSILAPGWIWRGALLTLLFTAAGCYGLALYWANKCEDPKRWEAILATGATGCFEFWVNRYQTLIAGLLALVGAFKTVWIVRRQISQVDRLEDQRRASESYAARAVLPLALSSISQYAEDCIQALLKVDVSKGDLSGFVAPAIPNNLVEPLRECIRFSNQQQARQIADLLAWLQIQSARLHSFGVGASPDTIVTHAGISDHVIDAAQLYIRASDLFDYGRRTEEGDFNLVPISRIRTALRNCGVWDGYYPKLDEWLEIREKNEAAIKARSG